MNISLDKNLIGGYKNKSQIARVLTETWTKENMYCPVCGHPQILHFPNNREVADFYCPNCKSEFEQKSRDGIFGSKIPDGAYSTFIQRINSNNNPDFFMMNYSMEKMKVEDFVFVPGFFFLPELVEKRKPLGENAKRAGWTGCNILYEKIPVQGRISIIEHYTPIDKSDVLRSVKIVQKLRTNDIMTRGWLIDVLNCVNSVEEKEFSLNMIYQFEEELSLKHPANHNIRAKIRQQLQKLRDCGLITFLGDGHYRKCT